MAPSQSKPSVFESIASSVTKATGGSGAFIIALGTILIWVITGPLFNFSDTWQLVINTGTTIITFLMVFLIQRTQNKDSLAIHLKLNELVASNELASNRLIAVEDISEADLKVLQKYYKKLADLAKEEMSVEESHSNMVADLHHKRKISARHSHKTK